MKKIDCTGCWNYDTCENKYRKDLVWCFRKLEMCENCKKLSECLKEYFAVRKYTCENFERK